MHGILISLYLAFSPFRQTYIFGHCHHSRFSRIRILNCYHITSQVISCHIIKTIADGEGQQSQVISFRIVPHHVSSHHILLYRVTYCHILSHHVTYCYILSHHVTYCHILSHHVTYCHIMSHIVTSSDNLSQHQDNHRWRKTTEPSSLQVPPCRSTCSIRRI